ncbi:hypothetical protein P4O66_002344 [Electrophorus voltai]|uniref:Uncharacterized protein n=1 Tax=Electrophorus voltai TaxID=2609070 RepID=A0AAD8YZ61_9TELE|nr:hypothetical protein P4O66_002344 [Electrophorus voltai]
MANYRAFHTQLATIMETLTRAAVTEICELVDDGYAILHIEISRHQKENEELRRKLQLIESIVAARGYSDETSSRDSRCDRALCEATVSRKPCGNRESSTRRTLVESCDSEERGPITVQVKEEGQEPQDKVSVKRESAVCDDDLDLALDWSTRSMCNTLSHSHVPSTGISTDPLTTHSSPLYAAQHLVAMAVGLFP